MSFTKGQISTFFAFMVHGSVLLPKPAVKFIAKWLLGSLEGPPKCAMLGVPTRMVLELGRVLGEWCTQTRLMNITSPNVFDLISCLYLVKGQIANPLPPQIR